MEGAPVRDWSIMIRIPHTGALAVGLKRATRSALVSRNIVKGALAVKRLRVLGRIEDTSAVRDFSIAWAGKVMASLGVEVECEGEPVSDRPVLFVGNHVSYLDIPALLTQVYSVFVAKSDVRDFPFIGSGAAGIGTIFVDRNSKDSRRGIPDLVHDALTRQRRSVTIFPEGTSTIEGIPWRRGIFRLAERMDLEIQPFRLCYFPVRESAYIGDDHMVTSVWNLLGSEGRKVSIKFFDPVRISPDLRELDEVEAMVKRSNQECLGRFGWESEEA